jgi:glycosyltransferase involved in cell wall biosynthesis
MTRPRISIVIPAFNAASVIAQTLESVRSQTFEDFEAIIVDDGSTDKTAAVVRRFCGADPRFHLVSQLHAGVSAARNAAMERTRGEFIAFLDADDIWFPKKLARQIEMFREDPQANFVYTNFFRWDGANSFSAWYNDDQPLPEGDVSRKLILNVSYACPASMSTAMVRREAFDRIGFFDLEFAIGEDWDMWLRMAEQGLWVRGIREPLACYRRWSGNATNQKLKIVEANVRVLEKNLRATRRPELRPLYQRSLAHALAKLELVRASEFLESRPQAVPGAIWRAWRFCPRELILLKWFILVSWPKFLGGRATERIVHRILKKKDKKVLNAGFSIS